MKNLKNRIFAVTTSRSDFGIQSNLIRELEVDKRFDLNLIVSGSHFNKALGNSYKEINLRNKNKIIKIKLNENNDDRINAISIISQILNKFKIYVDKIKPNLIILLGDRYETLPFAITAHIYNIPIAHIHGGELSYGSIDDSIRHSITKLSTYHFVSNHTYKKRVMQLGELPKNIYNVGSLALEKLNKKKLCTKNELENILNTKFLKKNILIVIHPLTLIKSKNKKNYNKDFINEILKSLSKLKNTKLFFSKPNADFGYKTIDNKIKKFVKVNKNAIVFESLGSFYFMSLMNKVDLILGNSSSGIIEAPSFNIPTINIGDRQKGRIKSESIIDCSPNETEISKKIIYAYKKKFRSKLRKFKNPYFKKNTSINIIKVINKNINRNYNYKTFYDL